MTRTSCCLDNDTGCYDDHCSCQCDSCARVRRQGDPDRARPPCNDLPARQVKALEERGRYLNRRERQCVYKVPHTHASALREAERLHAKGETRIAAYVCDRCERWHVGHLKQEG